MNDGFHRFIVHFSFHPRNDIQVGKGPGLETVGFKVLDLLQEFFKFRFQLARGNGDRVPKELKHRFLYGSKIFHLGHKAEN